MTVIKKSVAYFFLTLLSWLAGNLTWAQDSQNQNAFIMNHIRDAHAWHFATINHHNITLPLPIILISKDRGVEIFLSSRFLDEHHRHVAYKGYILNEQDQVISLESGRTFYDFSITKNLVYMFINVAVLLSFTLLGARWYQRHTYSSPKGFLGGVELIITFIRDDIAIPNIGTKHYMRFMPYLLSIFFFIWLNNLMGLLPSAANVTGNISISFVLAAFTFFITIINAKRTYWGHIFKPSGVPKWLTPIMVPIEILGMFTKPFSLMIRLFANITAGHIILLSIINLIFIFKNPLVGLLSVPFGTFMFLLKLLVAFLQAYIFTLLSAIYFGMAVEENH